VRRFLNGQEYKDGIYLDTMKSFLPNTWVRATVFRNLSLRIDLGDIGVSHNCLRDVYEKSETDFLRRSIKEGMTFVDVGANIGWFTLLGASKVGINGRVLAFEPRNDFERYLRRSMDDNGFSTIVECYNVAVGDKTDKKFIGWHEAGRNSDGTWFLSHESLIESYKRTSGRIQETDVVTIDNVLAGRKVDIIKIDIEGAEPIAFLGGQESLKRWHPLILSELNFKNLPIVSGVSPGEYVSAMNSLGYSCHLLDQGQPGSLLDLSSFHSQQMQ